MAVVDILRETAKWRRGIESAGGFSGLGLWRYRTAITSTPATGQMQFDDLTIEDATEMYFHETNDAGSDMTAFMDLIAEGDLLYVQIQADSSQFIIVQVGAPTKAASVYTFPIDEIEGQGSPPNNNALVALIVSQGSTGGSGNPAVSTINIQNGNYTFVIGDAGQTINKQSGGAGETYTIPASGAVSYPIGTWIAMDNDGGGDLTIAITTDTLEGTDGATGSRTLGDNQRALIQKLTATKWRYSASDL